MINKLIEKYKEKIEYYSKLDSVNCNIRAGLYTQILKDLEELKQECNIRFNCRVHFTELGAEYLKREIIGDDKNE